MQSSEVHIILQSCEKKRLDPPKRPTVRTHRFPKKTTFHWWVQGITFKIRYFVFIGGTQDSQTKPEICPQIAGGDIIESFIKICFGPGTFFKESGISSKGCFPFCAIEQSKNHMLHSKSNRHTPWNDAILKIKKNTSDKSNLFGCWLLISEICLGWITLDSCGPSRINPSQVVEAGQQQKNSPHLCQQKSFFSGVRLEVSQGVSLGIA